MKKKSAKRLFGILLVMAMLMTWLPISVLAGTQLTLTIERNSLVSYVLSSKNSYGRVNFAIANDYVSVEGSPQYEDLVELKFSLSNRKLKIKTLQANGVDLMYVPIDGDYEYYVKFDLYESTQISLLTRGYYKHIDFDANSGSGTMESQTFESGIEGNISSNTFTRSGYRFVGWNTAADGSGTEYANGQTVTFTPENDGDRITLYAQWERELVGAENVSVSFSQSEFTYNGEEQKPVVTVTHNGEALIENTDYTLQWPADLRNAGSKNVIVTFMGGFTGALEKSYEIIPKELTILWDEPGFVYLVYNGTEQFPGFTVGGIVTGDNVSVTRVGDATDVRHEYMGVITGITGADADNYKLPANTSKEFAVVPANPSLSTPVVQENLVYGTVLGNIELTDNWLWEDNNAMPEAGTHSYRAYYTPTDTDNYDWTVVEGWNPATGCVERMVEITAAYLPAPAPAYAITGYLFREDSTYYATDTIRLVAPEGYGISRDPAEGFSDMLVMDADNIVDTVYLIRNQDSLRTDSIPVTEHFVIDNTAPTLEGIEDGQTYYGDLTVIKTEEQFYDIASVTVDGEALGFAEGTYGLIPADDREHTVIVSDRLGNSTTYTVQVMKKLTVTLPQNPVGYRVETDITEFEPYQEVYISVSVLNGYKKGSNFALKVNGETVELTEYNNIVITPAESIEITVEGVARKQLSGGSNSGSTAGTTVTTDTTGTTGAGTDGSVGTGDSTPEPNPGDASKAPEPAKTVSGWWLALPILIFAAAVVALILNKKRFAERE